MDVLRCEGVFSYAENGGAREIWEKIEKKLRKKKKKKKKKKKNLR